MTLNILVVDDDGIDREAVKRYLSRSDGDIVCYEAATGEEAAYHMQTGQFDCVFLDYHLPDMDGISLLRKFYNTETGLTSFPIVMLTGQGTEGIMIDAIRWGAQDYLVKDNISRDTLYVALTKAREFFELKQSQSRAELLLRQSQKMDAVGQLTSGVAHDFNNLLTVILGNTRLIEKRLESDGEVEKEDISRKVQAIEAAARKGADLVKRLMVFTRQSPLEQRVADINEHIREIHELLRRTLGEMIEIKTILADDIWPVQIDTGQFENAFINMAVNARDAMPKGGRLIIETQNVIIDDEYSFSHPDISHGPYVMLVISDTGAGMAPETAKRIFEPFFTTKKAGEGTGLGLSMVYGLVRQSGGYIHVYSELNRGTAFRIYLPKMPAEGDSEDEGLHRPEGELPGGDETILIVEDDDEVRKIAVNMLERLGYKVLQASEGRMALETLKREHKDVDLIFTDIVMPGGMSGIELAARAQEYYPGTRVLYTSGYTENAIPDYQLIAGEALIGKPYRKEALAHKIRQVLDGQDKQ